MIVIDIKNDNDTETSLSLLPTQCFLLAIISYQKTVQDQNNDFLMKKTEEPNYPN